MMERKIKLKSVNPHITCFLCKGYLIDATTITECLHTFCKSCLVKYLEENNTCPSCKNLIHQSHPLNFISHDRTMQDIVYKLVPNLQEREQKRQEDFYRSRGIPFPRALAATDEAIDNAPPEDQDCHRSDEQVNICLEFKECKGQKMKALKRKFIRCSINATITQIKKFVALKVLNNACKFKDVDILCNDEILGKDHTLKFVAITRWRQKDVPLLLHYRHKLDL